VPAARSRVLGLHETEKALRLFPVRIAERILEQSLMAGARILVKGGRMRAPRGTGPAPKGGIRLRESIVARANLRTDKRPNAVHVGHRGPRRRLAHIIHFGRMSGTSDSGRKITNMPARPYLADALKADGQAAIRKTAETLRRKIPRIASELAGPYSRIKKVNRRRL